MMKNKEIVQNSLETAKKMAVVVIFPGVSRKIQSELEMMVKIVVDKKKRT
jgi:hypothetical protein